MHSIAEKPLAGYGGGGGGAGWLWEARASYTKRGSSQDEAGENSQRLLFFLLVGSLSGGKFTPKEQAGVQRLAQALLCREAWPGHGLLNPHRSMSEDMFHSFLRIVVGTSHHFHNWPSYSKGSR